MLRYKRVGVGERVREENSIMEGVLRCRMDHVGGNEEDEEDKGVDPGVLEGHGFPSLEDAASFSPLRSARDFGGRTLYSLSDKISNFQKHAYRC